jgi:hypothetical protein
MLVKDMMTRLLLLLVLGVGCAVQAVANDEQPIVVDTRAELIRAQQETIRSEALGKKGRYRDMEPATRDRLFQVQDQVFASLEGKSSSKELNAQDQVTLFNALEEISAIVNAAEENRMVCERVRRVGSHRYENVCKTVAQRRLERDTARNSLGNRDSRCLTAGCGSGDSTKPEGW